MIMIDVEDQLRTLLADRAQDAHSSADPVGMLERRLRRRRAGVIVAGVGLAVASIAGMTAIAVVTNPGDSGSSDRLSTEPLSTPTATSPGVVPPRTRGHAVARYFETDQRWLRSQFLIGPGRVYCDLIPLGGAADRGYVWIVCERFTAGTASNVAVLATGVSVPVAIRTSGRGGSTAVVSWRAPRGDAHFKDDVHQLFPQAVATRILRGIDTRPVLSNLQLRADQDGAH
jgi:hypothetical protein